MSKLFSLLNNLTSQEVVIEKKQNFLHLLSTWISDNEFEK